jgi:GT2 family glycosyltransferase
MKTIAVLITSFNRKVKTMKCLEKLFAQNSANFLLRVFLVDDGSSDGTSAAISKEYPQVQIIEGDGCLYWNRGMHKSWTEAVKYDNDFYLWLNDDTYLYKNAIKNMLETSSKVGGGAIIVGSTCSILNENLTTYGGRRGQKVIQIHGNEIMECSTFNGNFVLIPNSVYNKLGKLDYKFRHSFGDIEYGMRAINNNIKIYISPYHVGTCEHHDSIITCFSPETNILVRFKHFYSPLGMNPQEFFYMNLKYKGFFIASKIFISTHLRVLFPKLWLIK